MPEAAGPVYEGVGRPEVPKKNIVDKVLSRVKDRLKQNTGEIVEQKWMDAYQKTVDAIDPGARKKIFETVRPAAVAVAKVNRVGSAVVDVLLQLRGAFSVLRGGAEVVTAGLSAHVARSVARGALTTGSGIVDIILGRGKVARVASGWMADIAGAGGEKIAQIENKILRGKPKAMPAAS